MTDNPRAKYYRMFLFNPEKARQERFISSWLYEVTKYGPTDLERLKERFEKNLETLKRLKAQLPETCERKFRINDSDDTFSIDAVEKMTEDELVAVYGKLFDAVVRFGKRKASKYIYKNDEIALWTLRHSIIKEIETTDENGEKRVYKPRKNGFLAFDVLTVKTK